jgi:O-antigen ligase
MIAILIATILLLSIFCSFVLNRQHFAVFLVVMASSQMSAQATSIVLAVLFTTILLFANAFFSAKQNKLFLLILLLPIAYILSIFYIQPYKINIYHYLGYLAALLIFAWAMLLKWDDEKIVGFLTAYGSYLILAGFLEKIVLDPPRVGLALTVATAYAVTLAVAWTIWIINAFLSKIYSAKIILLGTFLVFLAIIFSGTRMGLLGILMGLGLCGLCAVFIKNKKLDIIKLAAYSISIIIALLFLTIIVWNLLPESLFIKKTFSSLIAGKLDDSSLGRLLIWYSAINIFEQNKLLGVGSGNFPEQLKSFLMSMGIQIRIDVNTHAHNIYLIVLSEHGIAGFLTLVTFVLLCIRRFFLYFLKNRQDAKLYALSAGFLIMGILGFVDAVPMYMPTTCFAAWMLGVCVSLRERSDIC